MLAAMSFGSTPPNIPTEPDFLPESLRGVRGFVRVGRTRAGSWWLIDPFGHGFIAKAVAGVNRAGRLGAGPGVQGEADGQAERFLKAAVVLLRSWNFNTLGAWAEPGAASSGVYFTEMLDFRHVGPAVHLGDASLPDVFDPEWAEAVSQRARERCQAHVASKELVGYFTDEALGWAQGGREGVRRPRLLQLCLSLEPSHRAYHAAWEYVLAPRRGDLAELGRDWGVEIAHRESIRQMTAEEKCLSGEAYSRDHYEFSREFARRYHAIASQAVRANDPNHLILGERWNGLPEPAVVAEAVHPRVDLLSGSPVGSAPGEAGLDTLAGRGQPLWLCDVACDFPAPLPPILAERLGYADVASRTIDVQRALLAMVIHPAIVGIEWRSWTHRPGEDPVAGSALVDRDERPLFGRGEALAEVNRRIEAQRQPATSPVDAIRD